ncbi:AraC family transcriptional regulator [Sphingobacterium thermophilum]|uniref:HTH araC/xylS-type domain-containing protein n=1 Tax=Sphingobacterium thermophilum TaxID=768534 RepID=A0ABP8R3T0_9SPHI
MELISEYIYLNISQKADLDSSFCVTTQDQSYILLTFGLSTNDCLFDLTDNNYEFQIRISKTYFEKYNETLDINVEKQTICCNTQAKLLEIINCKLTGIHRKIFLESNILYLLYQSQKNNLIFQLGCDSCAILNKPIEVEKINLAKKYILDNLSNNLTIPIIASNVGTNQCYLKKGFKEIFNQTIFEFIQENRMIKAKHLLQNPNPNITEIAFSVGYSSLSSFSQAYKNYFGISPLEQTKAVFPNN